MVVDWSSLGGCTGAVNPDDVEVSDVLDVCPPTMDGRVNEDIF